MTSPVPAPGQSAQSTTNFYDNVGRIWRTALADGTSMTNEFYPAGNLKQTSGSRTYPVEYTYDAQGRVQTMKTWRDFSGNDGTAVTTWNYDPLRGFLRSKQYADGQGPVYTNTSAGRLYSRTWARGITTVYSNDNAGQLIGINYSDSTPDVTFAYDRRGRHAQVTDRGMRTLAYNDAGAVLSDDYTVSSLNLGSQLRYGYDGLLRRTNLSNLSLGSTTGYGYDAGSRLSSVTDGSNTVLYSYVTNSPLIQSVTFKQGNNVRLTTSKGYDALNRLTNLANVAAASLSSAYGYNRANQRTNQIREDGSQWVYQYDALGQVTAGKKYWSDGTPVAGQQFEYVFDDIGNRTSTKVGGDSVGANLRSATYGANSLNQYTNRTVPGYVEVQGTAHTNASVTVNGAATYRKGEYYRGEVSVNNSGALVYAAITNEAVLTPDTVTLKRHALVAATPEAFTYDADGNLTSDGKWNYTWDGENRLIAVESVSAVPASAKQRFEYAYDHQGLRIYQKALTWVGTSYRMTTEERYWYDEWNLIDRADLASGLLQSFVWGLDLSGTKDGAGGVGGLLVMLVHNGTTTSNCFYSYDGNGNVAMLVSASSGTATANYEYDPFGNVLRADGPLAKLNPFRFSTKYRDEETGFIYYGFRYLNAVTGRWLSRDPIGNRGGLHLYAAFLNNSLSYTDKNGLDNWNNPTAGQNAPPVGAASPIIQPPLKQKLNDSDVFWYLLDYYVAGYGANNKTLQLKAPYWGEWVSGHAIIANRAFLWQQEIADNAWAEHVANGTSSGSFFRRWDRAPLNMSWYTRIMLNEGHYLLYGKWEIDEHCNVRLYQQRHYFMDEIVLKPMFIGGPTPESDTHFLDLLLALTQGVVGMNGGYKYYGVEFSWKTSDVIFQSGAGPRLKRLTLEQQIKAGE